MSACTLLLVAVMATVPESPGQTSAPHPQRPYHELSQEMRGVLRQEARATHRSDRAVHIHHLAELFLEVVSDPRIHTSDTLKAYKAQMHKRLRSIKRDLELELIREQKLRRRQSLPEPDPIVHAATHSLYQQMSLVDSTLGGPASIFMHPGAQGGGAVSDNGQELIELIQRTINPQFWDVNGGPGTIVYYAPLQALVVRATTEVHGRVGGLAEALRQAGK